MSLFFVRHPDERDLALFAGGELGPLSRWRIEKHLDDCDACNATVSDFFHLQGDLGELADLPAMDWNAMAHQIQAAAGTAKGQSAEPGMGWLPRPSAWQLGLVTATLLCAIVVVREWPLQQLSSERAVQAPKAEEPAALVTEADAPAEESFDDFRASSNEVLPESRSGVLQADLEGENQDAGRYRAARRVELASAPPVAEPNPVSPQAKSEQRPGSGPAVSSLDEIAAGASVVGGERRREFEFAETRPARAVRRDLASAEPGEEAQRKGDEKQAPQDPPEGLLLAQGRLKKSEASQVTLGAAGSSFRQTAAVEGPEFAMADALEPIEMRQGFSVLPDPGANQVGVASGGWVSVRSVDSETGVMTITNVSIH